MLDSLQNCRKCHQLFSTIYLKCQTVVVVVHIKNRGENTWDIMPFLQLTTSSYTNVNKYTKCHAQVGSVISDLYREKTAHPKIFIAQQNSKRAKHFLNNHEGTFSATGCSRKKSFFTCCFAVAWECSY